MDKITSDEDPSGGLLRFLTYTLMDLPLDKEGFPESEIRISISEYYFIPAFLYEAGAILGRAQHDNIDVLGRILQTTVNVSTYSIDKLTNKTKKRLEEFRRDNSGNEPTTFNALVLCTERISKTYWLNLDKKEQASIRNVEPYILSFLLEGIIFGNIFPELTKKMNRKFYDSVEINWDTWVPWDTPAPLALPKHIYCLPGEPSILSLEGQEETLLRLVGWYTSNFHPDLVNFIDLKLYSEDDTLTAHSRYRGWWKIYDTLLFSGYVPPNINLSEELSTTEQ